MQKVDYLPLGSVVLLKGGIKKLIIVARGLNVKLNHETKFFDYGGAQFPEGITGDEMAYFNQDGIAKVVFKGYSNEDDQIIVENINRFLTANQVEYGDPEALQKAETQHGV